VEREEDGLLCSSAEEMPVERRHDGEGARWREKRGGERRCRGGASERGHCGEVSFFFLFFRTVGG
jgi:hypothetical protein